MRNSKLVGLKNKNKNQGRRIDPIPRILVDRDDCGKSRSPPQELGRKGHWVVLAAFVAGFATPPPDTSVVDGALAPITTRQVNKCCVPRPPVDGASAPLTTVQFNKCCVPKSVRVLSIFVCSVYSVVREMPTDSSGRHERTRLGTAREPPGYRPGTAAIDDDKKETIQQLPGRPLTKAPANLTLDASGW